MKLVVLIAALALLPNLAAAQDKPAAASGKGGTPKEPPVAKVNGVAVPASHLELLMQQQRGRGMPDNAQTRQMIKDELVNREIVAQEAQRAGFSKKPELQAQFEMARQDIMVSAYLRDWVQKHPVSDDDVQKELATSWSTARTRRTSSSAS
jgi:hypothetical protein